jgi:hypothetical protein
LGERFYRYSTDENTRLDVVKILASSATTNSFIYVCGPQRLIDAVYSAAQELGIEISRLHSERFTVVNENGNKPMSLQLARSQKLIAVASTESVLSAMETAGLTPEFDCRVGNCGRCAVKVLAGEVDHRDKVLSAADKAEGLMCACVSRALSDTLVLDI